MTFTLTRPPGSFNGNTNVAYGSLGYSAVSVAGSADASGNSGVLGLAIFDPSNASQNDNTDDDFFGSRLLRWLTVPYRSRLFSVASRPFYQVADRILGSHFLQDIADFFILFQTMEKGFVRHARQVERLLSGSGARRLRAHALLGRLAPADDFADLTNGALELGARVFGDRSVQELQPIADLGQEPVEALHLELQPRADRRRDAAAVGGPRGLAPTRRRKLRTPSPRRRGQDVARAL